MAPATGVDRARVVVAAIVPDGVPDFDARGRHVEASVISRFVMSDATATDYEAFVGLFPELAVPDPLPSAERFAEVVAPQAIFARDGDAIVGYAWSRPRGERLHVVHVITDPAHRRRGVGRALMFELLRRARVAGLRRWMPRPPTGTVTGSLAGPAQVIRNQGMGRQATVVLYVLALIAAVVGVDVLFFRNRFLERLMVNVGIVLVFTAFYLRFLKRP